MYARILDATLVRAPGGLHRLDRADARHDVRNVPDGWQSKELAPVEDQGFVLGFVEGPPDATIEQTTLYTEELNRMMMAVPEARQTFQITFPDSGFGGHGAQAVGRTHAPRL